MASPEFSARVTTPSSVPFPSPDFAAVANGNQPNGFARFQSIFNIVAVVADFLAVNSALGVSYFIYQFFGLGKQIRYEPLHLLGLFFVFAFVFVALLEAKGGYRSWNSLLRVKETETILRATGIAFLIAFTLSVLSNYFISRWLLALAFLMVPIVLSLEKHLMFYAARAWHSRGYGVQRAVIYGAGSTGRRIFTALVGSPKLGLDPVCFLDDDATLAGSTVFAASYARRRCASVISGPLDRAKLKACHANHVLIGIPSISRSKFKEIATEAAAAGATVSFVPRHFAPSDYWVDYVDVDGVMLASFRSPDNSYPYQVVKRIFDFVVAALLLVATLPLFLIVSAAIRLTSKGPALFVHERIGYKGKPFRMCKFRTMYCDAPQYEFSPSSAGDRRITPIGRYLRHWSLDELPQLLNVLKGDMSLVGPRPEMPFIVAAYNQLHRERLQIRPGITGLWQLSADRAHLIHENIEYDLYYIRNRNFMMDLAILFHTLIFAMRGI